MVKIEMARERLCESEGVTVREKKRDYIYIYICAVGVNNLATFWPK